MNCRRDSAAQMTTIDATLMDTTSLGKTGSDPVDETKTRSQPEYHGKSNLLLFNTGLSLFNTGTQMINMQYYNRNQSYSMF